MALRHPVADTAAPTSHLSAPQTARLRELLDEERSAQTARLAELETAPDLEADLVSVLRDHCLQALDDVDAALARLVDGTYGSCATCRSRIPAERLEAVPSAGLCVGCQAAAKRALR